MNRPNFRIRMLAQLDTLEKFSRRNSDLLLLLLTIASCCSTVGCNRRANNQDEAQGVASGTAKDVRQSLESHEDSTKGTDEIRRPARLRSKADFNPDAGISTTEATSQRIDKQLKRLADEIVGKHESTAALDDIFAEQFSGETISTSQLRETYSDSEISVSRLDDKSSRQTADASGFIRFLAQDVKAQGKCKFKVFRIKEQQVIVTTSVRLRQSGESTSGAIQQTTILQCEWTNSDPPRLRRVSIDDLERVALNHRETIFQDCTESILAQNDAYEKQLVYGLDHWLDRLELYHGIVATSYHGLSVADINGDGLDDLYTCQPGGIIGGLPNRLFLQNPDGTATDFSLESRLNWLTETHCALFVDFDNDGDQDMVGSTMAGLIFAENDGTGRFTLKVHKLIPEAPPISLAAADFDNDGDVDVYVCCYGRRASAEIMGRPMPYHDAKNGSRNALFRNDQAWRFKNVTKAVGLEQHNRRFSLACAWEDFDNDGDQDLYVANDFGRNNLYRNDNSRFTDVAAELRVEDMSAGMSVSWDDFDNDGRMDLYVSNMWSSAGNRVAYQKEFLNGNEDPKTRFQFQRHARGNSLFSNSGNRFVDVSLKSKTTMAGWAWSSRFADLNNDGWQDLVVANGYITQENPKDL